MDAATEIAQFTGDIAKPSAAVVGKRLLLAAAAAVFLGAAVWGGWYWSTTGRFIESRLSPTPT